MHSLLAANLHYLRQGISLLDRLDDDLYSTPVMSFYGSTVGGHLRHCLDHYESFVAGLTTGRIDYDARVRDKALEMETSIARGRIEYLIETLDASSFAGGRAVEVKMDCGGAEEVNWQASTYGRELQFLVSHTVHHFAMMSGLCSALSVELPPDFGMAPSTLRHQARA